ncbi:extracellular solute-binding protein [Bartonella sp. HY329]|uniref:extracellular solute-binding protein n=1 Tax=unclassified Bartonella TaxID=2645622 RepID=UPI0021CA9C10|nr:MULTISPECIES: extracellular solute-binding protein [unclassified Bartonella]UXM95159.1 extracellular solute-binding protein [Bartonella sp. HY329]UXN09482.1 extracellular solute-binding protein [Bartonella sp. HY328]
MKFLKIILLTALIIPFHCAVIAFANPVNNQQEKPQSDDTQQSLPKTEPIWRTSTSLGVPPKYGADFKHYDYVNPNAKKGGTFNDIALQGTFDNFNFFIPEGTADRNILLIYDTLMAGSTEQEGVNYPLIATAVQYPDDYSWVKFKINDKAKFHDGTPVTPEDVVWSFDIIKKYSTRNSSYYSAVKSAKVTGKNEVTFTFVKAGNRELPNILGQLRILPKHWWEAKDASGKQRDFSKPLREIPLGSGPYRLENYNPGKSTLYKRVDDYWGKDLPVNVGRYNFDALRYTYYFNDNAKWEAFKKGGISDFRQENTIQSWMQNYNFSAVENGLVKRESFENHGSGRMQGYFLNIRREKFNDIRVRKALNLAFNFEQMNRLLFFNKYERITSYFYGLDFVSAQELPKGKELQLLESVKNEIPAELFQKPFTLPKYSKPTDLRKNLSEAMQLLQDAGWRLKNNQLVNAQGQPFTIEFLLDDARFERATSFYIANLKRLGIDVTMRTIDDAQYQNRLFNFDYDVISIAIGQSNSPGNEQLNFFSSAAADINDSGNYVGIKNPAVDKMINEIIYAKDRDDLIAATRAMDRILLWNYYVVPQWTSSKINIAYWDKFDIPRPQPEAAGYDIFSWSIDQQKEQALKQSIGNR